MEKKIPDHLFVGDSTNGALYDTRQPDWSRKAPLRPIYRYTFATIENAAQLKATLRNGAYACPGGYPLFFITADGAALSFEAVRAELRQCLYSLHTSNRRDGWHIVACDINYEDGELYCAHSGERIESAYAETDYKAIAESHGWQYVVSRFAGNPTYQHSDHGVVMAESWQEICESYGLDAIAEQEESDNA